MRTRRRVRPSCSGVATVRGRRGTSLRFGSHQQHHDQHDEGKARRAGRHQRRMSITYFVRHAPTGRRSAIPPTYASGMLEKPPIAAAPNAWTTRNVNSDHARGQDRRSSTPDRAANDEPMIHAHRRTATGLEPVSRQQIRIVDDGTHRGAEARVPEVAVERRSRDEGHDHDDDLLPLHVHARDLDRRRGQERREAPTDVFEPDAADRDDPQHETDRRRDLATCDRPA